MKAEAINVKFLKDSDDYGIIFNGTCPDCKCRVWGYDDGNPPFHETCECGYKWKLEIELIGSKEEQCDHSSGTYKNEVGTLEFCEKCNEDVTRL